MSINARTKGKEGEREFINTFGSLFPNEIKRNLDQTREGGSDITGCDPFVIEVKRVERLDLNKWWRQVKVAVTQHPQCSCNPLVPIVAYRQSRQQWKFLLPATLLGVTTEGYIIADMETFIKFVTLTYKE